MMIEERPRVVSVVPVRDGYTARALCLVDGLPAETRARVDTDNPRHSDYWIRVWDPEAVNWTGRVYELDHEEVGLLPPLLIAEPEVLARLNHVFETLWYTANAIVRTGRERRENLEDVSMLHRARMTRTETGAGREDPPPDSDPYIAVDRGEMVGAYRDAEVEVL